MGCVIDEHVGRRLRRRRRLVGLTQAELGAAIGVRFQQIQKYECAANKISASRLYELAHKLEVDVGYFFEGFEAQVGVAA
jgi:transcriptional regulator with XRE-family HTH domain